ncbi:MAG: UDP-glucose 4-epimerase GalE [Anaerovoracaceae bacterium]|jgi:UDP-glucose 4-epimerase
MKVLATGGAGFIGSHTCVALLEEGYDVVAVDNLYNSSDEAIRRIEQITGKELRFYNADVCSRSQMNEVFDSEPGIDAVIHFAGYKAVGESVEKPLEYYCNNLSSTMVLCEVMREHGCKNIIFSSSATVYGQEMKSPITEEHPKGVCSNPYAWSKWMIEQILIDLHTGDPEWNVILLRYFNPIGAHPSGLIGEDPKGIPNNLLPYVAQVAIGKLPVLGVFGDDYDTPDGTGVRDYLHVMDLAYGHVAALKRFEGNHGVDIYNLGTGKGSSVLEVVHAFEKACGKKIPYEIKPRRAGDLPAYWCDPSKAERELGWKAKYDLYDMCRDSWNWQKKNPNGYEG